MMFGLGGAIVAGGAELEPPDELLVDPPDDQGPCHGLRL
jgi:hypothetical protein